jgi:hypothetical protein
MEFTRCIYCKIDYKPNEGNTKIYGPYVEITCPYCGRKFEGKFLNLVDLLRGEPRASLKGSLKGAAAMQKLAQLIETSSVDNSKGKGKPGKEKKKPPKDKKKNK